MAGASCLDEIPSQLFGVLGWRDSISSGYVPPELQRSNHFGAKSTPKEKRRGGQNENQPEFPC